MGFLKGTAIGKMDSGAQSDEIDRYYILKGSINFSSWKLFSVVSLDSIYSKTDKLKSSYSLIILITVVVSILMAIAFWRLISSPIIKLSKK